MLSADVMILLDWEAWENEFKFKEEEEKARNKRISQTNWSESQRRSWVLSVGELFIDYETRMKAIYNIHWEIFSATNSIIIQEKEKLLTETRLDGNHKSWEKFWHQKKESESENNLMVVFFPNLQEHQLATKPWKGPSVFHSQGLSSC